VIHPASRPALPPVEGQICVIAGVDIAGFTDPGRDDDIRRFLHKALYGMLMTALDQAGISWDDCSHEDRGDGVLLIMPPSITVRSIIDPFLRHLRAQIRLHNHACQPAAKIQLRVAAHIGPVDHDGEGFVGTDVNHMARLLDARPLKRALAATGADLAFIASEYLYSNVVCRYPTLVSPDDFQPVRFQVKYTRAKAWIYLPGLPQLLRSENVQAAFKILDRSCGGDSDCGLHHGKRKSNGRLGSYLYLKLLLKGASAKTEE